MNEPPGGVTRRLQPAQGTRRCRRFAPPFWLPAAGCLGPIDSRALPYSPSRFFAALPVFRKGSTLAAALCILSGPLGALEETSDKPDVKILIPWLLEEDRNLEGIPFAKVIESATGNQVVPFDPETDSAFLRRFSTVVERAFDAVNKGDHPAHTAARINEASGHLEDELLYQLNQEQGWSATIPTTADGRTMRAGYPDIRLETENGRVVYVDPKLYADGSRESSFRTFYYEPKVATNKVGDSAMHLLIGFRHNRQPGPDLRLLGWEIVDLAKLNVRLKAEFQASNQDLYHSDNILLERPPDAKAAD